MPAKLTQAQVIEKFRAKHGDRYDYSQVVYTHAHGKVVIVCPDHGPFEQPAHGHWQGTGCRACGYEKVSSDLTMSINEAKQKLVGAFGLRAIFDLDRFESATKTKVLCVTHGWITSTMYNLCHHGCTMCQSERQAVRRKQPLTYEDLVAHVTPDMETGRLYHRVANRGFSVGDEYVYQEDRHGYLRTVVFRRNIAVHRVILAFKLGRIIPREMDCDHINGVPWDNRPANLRDVPHRENSANRAIGKNNSTGAMGVHYCNSTNKYIVRVYVKGVTYHIGRFDDLAAAIAARKAAEPRYGFHENHNKPRKDRAKYPV